MLLLLHNCLQRKKLKHQCQRSKISNHLQRLFNISVVPVVASSAWESWSMSEIKIPVQCSSSTECSSPHWQLWCQSMTNVAVTGFNEMNWDFECVFLLFHDSGPIYLGLAGYCRAVKHSANKIPWADTRQARRLAQEINILGRGGSQCP